MRVLFVDDEPNVLSGIRRMLRPERKIWDMRFVGSGREALLALEEAPADLIVSDIRMPHMSGVELLAEVRVRWPQTLRMVLSGESDRDALLRTVGPTHQYLCKPCRPEALRASLQRMDAMLEMLQGADLRAVAGGFDSLPTPSTAYAEAMAVLDDPTGSAARLADVIGADVGMSTALLRVANSAYVGLSSQVASVHRAIALLGTDLVRAILTVAGLLRSSSDHPAVRSVLVRSRVVVADVRALTRDCPPEVRQQAELSAMLHNVGALVLLGDRPDIYAPLLDLPREEREALEIQRYGVVQPVIGAYLLGVWGLPAPVMIAVARQEHPPPDDEPTSAHSFLYRALHLLEEAA